MIQTLLVGGFNLIRKPADRNKPGGNSGEMLLFNAALSQAGLEEIPFKGKKYTWTNKQENPLFQRLDWFFCSASWALNYTGSVAPALSRDTSYHDPCKITISTDIPKAKVFRFENLWLQREEFMEVMQNAWDINVSHPDLAKKITGIFKNLRKV